MVEIFAEFSRYYIALLFGAAAACSFAGIEHSRKNNIVLCSFTLFLFVLQLICLKIWGMGFTSKIYPLLSHLPVVIFIVLYLKRSLLIALTSMFVSFLCCQPSRWVGAVYGQIFVNAAMDHAGYILTAFLMYYLLQKYTVKSVRHLLERSVRSCLLFGAMPALYYLFDYGATVYTDFIYSGTRAALQFMPFVISAFYLIFVLFYYDEIEKQINMQREMEMLDVQFKNAQKKLHQIRQLQQNAAAYRHDMRHHLALLQGLALDGRIDEIEKYLRTALSDIDDMVAVRFCENETVNMILSSYMAKAEQSAILLELDVTLPELLPFSETELCSLLSNGLENAINACTKIPEGSKRHIKLRLYSKNNKLCIDIRNSYSIEPVFNFGLPVSIQQGHGFGTRSMAHIVEKHGGVFRFLVKDGWFIFQATA